MLYYHLYLYDLFAFNVLKLNGNTQLRMKYLLNYLMLFIYCSFQTSPSILPITNRNKRSLGEPSTELSMVHRLSTERPLTPVHPKELY